MLDIDGVCADFVGPVLKLINEKMGVERTQDDITEWDIYRALGVPAAIGKEIDLAIQQPGFCRSLALYPGAREGVEALRQFADVYPVTAPFSGPNWISERETWLVEELGFNRRDVVFTSNKNLVSGDYLVDDKGETLISWATEHPDDITVQFLRPWNRKFITPGTVVSDWSELVERIATYEQRT